MQWRVSPSFDLVDKNIFTQRTPIRSRTVREPLVAAITMKFGNSMIKDLSFELEQFIRLQHWILTIVFGAFTSYARKQCHKLCVSGFGSGTPFHHDCPCLTLREIMYVHCPESLLPRFN